MSFLKITATVSLIFFMLVFVSSMAHCADIPSVIKTQAQAEFMMDRAKSLLMSRLGMTFRYPIVVKLVSGKELDAIAQGSPYRGSIVGLHKFEGGKHVIYMMNDTGRDDFFGTACHELTHGWQVENCPYQEEILKEGLAVWVQYKALGWDGAYYKARQLNEGMADPVYGVGYRFVQKLEDKYGETGVLNAVRQITSVPANS